MHWKTYFRLEDKAEEAERQYLNAFLRTTSRVPDIELEELMVQAVEMYLMDGEERNVKTTYYEGKLYTQRSHEILGGFGGQRFDAELETTQGRDSATFLETGSGLSTN